MGRHNILNSVAAICVCLNLGIKIKVILFSKLAWWVFILINFINKFLISKETNKTHKNFWEKDKNGKWIRLREWMATYSSRQIRTPIVREDTGLACASRAFLWREGKRIGDSVEIITNDDDFTSIDIHNLEDLLLAEAAIEIRKKLKKI